MIITTYTVTVDAWIDGHLRPAGSTVRMAPAAAKYWLLAGTLKEADTAPTAKPTRKARAE